MTDAAAEPTTAAMAAAATAPTLPTGAPATCRNCAAPLAADQRYCLTCGVRVASPRVDYLGLLTGDASPGGAATAPAATGSHAARSFMRLLDRIGGPMGAAAVVLVALGVGYLLGQGGSEPATIIQRPPIVNVQGGGAAGAATQGATTTTPATTAKQGKGRAAGGSGSTAGVAPATQDSSGGDLNRLQQQPTEQATQGAPPRRDNKQAGGGTDAETIG